MTTPLSVRRPNFRRTEPNEVVLKERLDGPDRLSGQQQASDLIVQAGMIAQCSTKSFCRIWPKPIVWHNG
jgi:hypothetical protein